jgi:hypothetical protein
MKVAFMYSIRLCLSVRKFTNAEGEKGDAYRSMSALVLGTVQIVVRGMILSSCDVCMSIEQMWCAGSVVSRSGVPSRRLSDVLWCGG